MTVNREVQRSLIPHAVNIDRRIGIIGKNEIHQTFRDGCVLGRVHIGNQHRMVMTLIHLEFRFQHRVIEGRGNLTDTAAVGVHHLAALVGGRRIITVVRIERRYRRRHGESLSRHNESAVDLGCSHFHVCISLVGRTIVGGGRSQHIFYLAQFFFCHRRLLNLRHDCELRTVALQRFHDGGNRLVHVDGDAGLSAGHFRITVGKGDIAFLCISVIFFRKLLHIGFHSLLVGSVGHFKVFRFHLQIFFVFVLFDEVAALGYFHGLMNHFAVGPLHTEILRRGSGGLISDFYGIISAGSFSQLLFYCFCRLLLRHPGNVHASDVDILADGVCLIRQGRGSCCQKKSRADGQDQACFLTFFHSVTPLADLLQITQNHGQNHSDHQKNADHCCNGFLCFFIVKIHHSFHLLIFPYREIMLSIIRDASLLVSFSGTASVSIL